MTIKTILTGASGGTAGEGTIDLALTLARRFSAHLEAIHVRTDMREILTATDGGDFMGASLTGQWIDQMEQEIATNAAKVKQAFAAATLRHDVPPGKQGAPGPSVSFNDITGLSSIMLPERARFFDLVVLGRSERAIDRAHSDVIEQTLLHSGRPVLLAPATMSKTFGEVIAVGWDGSPQAVRAVTASMPFLEQARRALVITIGDTTGSDPAALVAYLARHEIAATHRFVAPVGGVGPGTQLLARAREEGAELLVMGGYGHAPWREFLFGGATQQAIGQGLLPLFLVH
ncbi:MAG TPA: universal stress protein [Methyloceanibacter sp.]|nr:universal stress protein [Methyloceanibacter sp.]